MAHMNCAGVTCLSIVTPSGNLFCWPLYLAETNLHVPTNSFAGFASAFSGSAAAEHVGEQAIATPNAQRIIAIGRIETAFLKSFIPTRSDRFLQALPSLPSELT